MYRLMLAQCRQLSESFAASLAFKVSLVGVRWQVPHQRILMPELLRTWVEYQALILFLPCFRESRSRLYERNTIGFARDSWR